jgi:EmrB/QacA subfamily drug resistance transporter
MPNQYLDMIITIRYYMSMTSSLVGRNAQHERRWLVLAVVGLAQLMLVLDLTIMNVALPSAQHALGFSIDSRQWIVTAYALAFGSLLLLGGRIGDLWGRKWTLVGGLLGFAVASAVGGASTSFAMLVSARAVQGVFAALVAPSALGLLTTTFTEPSERGKAFGIYGAIAGGGSALGLLLGGILTQAFSWRLCMYVNVALALPAVIAALVLVVNQRPSQRPRIDLAGAVTVSTGLFALVYGFSNAELHGWSAPVTVAMLVAACVLLCTFVLVESRVAEPLLPLGVVADRARGGAYLALMTGSCALFGVFLFLTYFLQRTRGFDPIDTGLAFLPLTVGVILASTVSNIKLIGRFGPRPVIAVGMTLGAGAMAWLSQLSASSGYLAHVLPPLFVLGLGYGATTGPAFFTATANVEQRTAGTASATANASQQVGGAVGAAALSTIFASAVVSFAHSHSPQDATVHGYTVAFWAAAAVLAVGAAIVGVLIPNRRRLLDASVIDNHQGASRLQNGGMATVGAN